MKIYQNLPKFVNLRNIGNVNFPVREEIRYLCHVTTYDRVQERKENEKWGGEMPHSIIKYGIFANVSSFLA